MSRRNENHGTMKVVNTKNKSALRSRSNIKDLRERLGRKTESSEAPRFSVDTRRARPRNGVELGTRPIESQLTALAEVVQHIAGLVQRVDDVVTRMEQGLIARGVLEAPMEPEVPFEELPAEAQVEQLLAERAELHKEIQEIRNHLRLQAAQPPVPPSSEAEPPTPQGLGRIPVRQVPQQDAIPGTPPPAEG